ncbi:hypothetical protein [Nocardia jinanensis]|uniref:Uncharacterized protein n=1 Tax=Nocardia jinanensis TaxID=382504 RepID=A0A917RBI5_9NOCA|nr:hypothetical protein [Nocardia jinanensis]GGK99838.1 hypothetical protein GCM10011588_13080 [Nocardia jinanensis]
MPPVKLGAHTTGYALYLLNGLRTTYPELNIESLLTDSGRYWLERARTACLSPLGDELVTDGVVIPTDHDGAVNDSLPDSVPFVRDLFA